MHARSRRLLGCLALALLATWPLALHLREATVGFSAIDALDTLMLRGLFADLPAGGRFTDQGLISRDVFYPIGYPILGLMPNGLDQLSAAPLVWLLPFPLSDNLWWLAVLVANGLAAHRLGRRAGGSEGAGWLAAVAWVLSDPLLREANLHHAPQALCLWAPLYLDAVLALREEPTPRAGARAGLWLALAALSYWYLGLFLGLGALPLLLRPARRRPAAIGAFVGVLALICAPFLAPLLLGWSAGPVTGGGQAPPPSGLPASFDGVPEGLRFVAWHGADPLQWLRSTPIDLSNRASLALLAAAALGAGLARGRGREGQPLDRGALGGLLAMAALGAVMTLGPVLRWGDGVVLWRGAPISLPFGWLGALHPVLGRLHWPERWGLLVPLALLPLAARARRPGVWAAVVALEALLLSANLPLQTLSLRGQRCWAELSHASGAILELPLSREGLLAPRVGVHRRFHRRPVLNPMLLPPGSGGPEAAWRAWAAEQPLLTWIRSFEEGRWPKDPGAAAVRSLRDAGLSALAVDAEPDALLSENGLLRYRLGLSRILGPPIDLGCALVWWLDQRAPAPQPVEDGAAWRVEAAAWSAAHPAPALDALVAPRGPQDRPSPAGEAEGELLQPGQHNP